MNLIVERITLEQWNEIAEDAHLTCFNEIRKKEMNTFDFAIVTRNEKELCTYATCIEMDKDSVYMQHGGAFPNVARGVYTVKGYLMTLSLLKETYRRASTRIQNINIPMLKLALAAGFLVNGVDNFDGEIFLHLRNEFGA